MAGLFLATLATLVLAGVTVASFFTAVQTFVQQQNTETLQEVTSWILGHIFSFQPELPVTARMILPFCARMKRGVASHECRSMEAMSGALEPALSSSVTRPS